MTEVRPVCLFCCQRFSLAAGQGAPCEDARAEGRHVERLRATAEDHARARKPRPVVDTKHRQQIEWEKTDAYKAAAAAWPAAPLTPSAPAGQIGFGI